MAWCGCNRFVAGEPWIQGRDCRACWLYANDPHYRALRAGEPMPSQPRARMNVTVIRQGARQEPARQVRRRGWPGSRLKDMLASIGISVTSDCGCNERAQIMDRWGVEGCRAHRDVIVRWLQEDSAKMAGYQGDPAELDWGPMVDEAIRRAEVEEET